MIRTIDPELQALCPPLRPDVQEVLTQEDAGEPAPVGREAAQKLIGEMFDRSEGRPEEASA